MAGGAISSDNGAMIINRLVTGIAVLSCTLVNSVDVTGGTGHRGVLTGQREGGSCMVHRRLGPVGGVVTGRTGGAVGPVMLIIRLMAGVAVFSCAFIDAIDMTGRAGHRNMVAGQGEGSLGSVINGGSRPA